MRSIDSDGNVSNYGEATGKSKSDNPGMTVGNEGNYGKAVDNSKADITEGIERKQVGPTDKRLSTRETPGGLTPSRSEKFEKDNPGKAVDTSKYDNPGKTVGKKGNYGKAVGKSKTDITEGTEQAPKLVGPTDKRLSMRETPRGLTPSRSEKFEKGNPGKAVGTSKYDNPSKTVGNEDNYGEAIGKLKSDNPGKTVGNEGNYGKAVGKTKTDITESIERKLVGPTDKRLSMREIPRGLTPSRSEKFEKGNPGNPGKAVGTSKHDNPSKTVGKVGNYGEAVGKSKSDSPGKTVGNEGNYGKAVDKSKTDTTESIERKQVGPTDKRLSTRETHGGLTPSRSEKFEKGNPGNPGKAVGTTKYDNHGKTVGNVGNYGKVVGKEKFEKDAPAAGDDVHMQVETKMVAKFASPFLLMEDEDAGNMQSVRRWNREFRECLNAVIMGDGSDEGWRSQVAMQQEMGSNLYQSRRATAALWHGGPH